MAELPIIFSVLSQIFEQYGVVALIIILLITAVAKFSGKFTDRIVTKILDSQEKNHTKSLTHRKNNVKKIYEILTSLIKDYKANRAVIFEFHNGGANLSGLQFLHTSATMEVDQLCTTQVHPLFQNVLVSIVPKLIEDLEANRTIYVTDIEQINEKYSLIYQIFKNNNTKSLIIYPLNGVNNPIGFIIMAFEESFAPREIPNYKGARTEAQKICSLLDYKNIK